MFLFDDKIDMNSSLIFEFDKFSISKILTFTRKILNPKIFCEKLQTFFVTIEIWLQKQVGYPPLSRV